LPQELVILLYSVLPGRLSNTHRWSPRCGCQSFSTTHRPTSGVLVRQHRLIAELYSLVRNQADGQLTTSANGSPVSGPWHLTALLRDESRLFVPALKDVYRHSDRLFVYEDRSRPLAHLIQDKREKRELVAMKTRDFFDAVARQT
jgi:hypothetical protein